MGQLPESFLNMRPYDNTDMIGATFTGFLIGGFIALCSMQYFNVTPLQEEAIKRGYASYTIPNTNRPTMSVFTWK